MQFSSQQLLMLHLANWSLVFARITAFLQGAPFFGSGSIPGKFKAFIPAVISFAVYLTLPIKHVTELGTLFQYGWLVFLEVMIGLLLAYVSQMVYLPLRMMGMMVGRSSGFGRGFVINPDDEDQSTILQQFVYILGILMFFVLNGHHLILRIAIMTFEWIPLGGFQLNGPMMELVARYFAEAFNRGVVWAAPIMGCILIGTFSFGILGKSVPQMNLLIIDLPVRIVVGLTGIAIAIPYLIALFEKYLFYTIKIYKTLIVMMGGG